MTRQARTEGRQDGAVSNGAVGATDHEVVRETMGGNTHVSSGLILPGLSESLAIQPGDGEAGAEGHIKAGGADEDIHGVFLSITTNNTLLGELLDRAIHDLDLLGAERLEVVDTGGDALAADAPGGDDEVLEALVAELVLHHHGHTHGGGLLDLGVGDEDGPEAAEAGLERLAVLEECLGVALVQLALLRGVDVLLLGLDGGDPCWRADESGDFSGLVADGGEDLDTRRTRGKSH